MKTDVITLTRKQLIRFSIINKATAGFITVSEAALALGLSERQIKRLKKDVKENGAAALVHKNSLRKPTTAISDAIIAKIIELKSSKPYKNANFKHFVELLSEYHDIKLSYSSLHRILVSNGLLSPKTKRRFKPHRRRSRRPQAGLLLQVDATPFSWFGGKAKYALHGAIDDATGNITALFLSKNECLQGYFEMLRRTIKRFGVPVSLYADRHTIFRSPNADKISIEKQLKGISAKDTQFGRALRELGIQLIAARSPQAKGRIERLWETLQSRLPVEFALRNIKSLDQANAFLPAFIENFNELFSVIPENLESAFGSVPKELDLDLCLCVKDERTLDRGGVFSYYNKYFKIVDTTYSELIPANAKVTICVSPVIGIKIKYKQLLFDALRYIKPKKISAKIDETEPRIYKPQAPGHCWKNYDKTVPRKSNLEESDQEIMSMLSDIFLKGYA
jgi:transposase